jgi:hypothetical protein
VFCNKGTALARPQMGTEMSVRLSPWGNSSFQI